MLSVEDSAARAAAARLALLREQYEQAQAEAQAAQEAAAARAAQQEAAAAEEHSWRRRMEDAEARLAFVTNAQQSAERHAADTRATMGGMLAASTDATLSLLRQHSERMGERLSLRERENISNARGALFTVYRDLYMRYSTDSGNAYTYDRAVASFVEPLPREGLPGEGGQGGPSGT